MAAPIQVPAGFKADFNYYCERAGIVGREQAMLRNEVRADFDTVGRWVQECAKVYRFADSRWGGLPSSEQCQNFLASRGMFYEDETLFERLGIFLQVKMCARAAGALD